MKPNSNSNNISTSQLLHNYDYELASNLLKDIVAYDLKSEIFSVKQKPIISNYDHDTAHDNNIGHKSTKSNNEFTMNNGPTKKKMNLLKNIKNKLKIKRINTSSTSVSSANSHSNNSAMVFDPNNDNNLESRLDKSITATNDTTSTNEHRCADNNSMEEINSNLSSKQRSSILSEKYSLGDQPKISESSSFPILSSKKDTDLNISDYLESTVNSYVTQQNSTEHNDSKVNNSYRVSFSASIAVKNKLDDQMRGSKVDFSGGNNPSYKSNCEEYVLEEDPGHPKQEKQLNTLNGMKNRFVVIQNANDTCNDTTITSATKYETSKLAWDTQEQNKSPKNDRSKGKEVRFAKMDHYSQTGTMSEYTKKAYDDATYTDATSHTTATNNNSKIWEIYIDLLSEIIFLYVVKDPFCGRDICCAPKRVNTRKERQSIKQFANDLYDEILNKCRL